MDVNQKKPLVSIIVPVYKTEAYLDQCVQSLLGQTYEKIEVILVDDGSPDRCPVLCDEYARRDSRVKVVHKCNEGAAFARKAGIMASSGQHLLMVDSDDWLDADTVACCVETTLRDDAGCVQFSYVREYPNKSIENPLFEADFSYDEDNEVLRDYFPVKTGRLHCAPGSATSTAASTTTARAMPSPSPPNTKPTWRRSGM